MINLECPANDWMCPYFDNGRCTLETAKVDCEFMAEEEDEQSSFFIADKFSEFSDNFPYRKGLPFYYIIKLKGLSRGFLKIFLFYFFRKGVDFPLHL